MAELTNQYQGQGLEEIYAGNDLPSGTSQWRHTARAVNFRNRVSNVVNHNFTDDEIDEYELNEAISNHPLARRPTNIRSKLAYKEILSNLKPTKKYLLPGQCVVFEYLEPKYKEELEYYDRTPFTLFLGITKTKDDTIREIGLNLHYFPPFTRAKILNQTYEAFKPYFQKYFNNPSKKPNTVISWDALKHIMKSNSKLAFGIKMYIPVLRSKSFVLPTKYLSTAFYTEGHFSKATLQQIFRFWRQF
jgi:hypothetical protein